MSQNLGVRPVADLPFRAATPRGGSPSQLNLAPTDWELVSVSKPRR